MIGRRYRISDEIPVRVGILPVSGANFSEIRRAERRVILEVDSLLQRITRECAVIISQLEPSDPSAMAPDGTHSRPLLRGGR
jgi:hypothetical protein